MEHWDHRPGDIVQAIYNSDLAAGILPMDARVRQLLSAGLVLVEDVKAMKEILPKNNNYLLGTLIDVKSLGTLRNAKGSLKSSVSSDCTLEASGIDEVIMGTRNCASSRGTWYLCRRRSR